MRHFSTLTQGTTIALALAGARHYLDVVETRPGPVISLFGTVDLEVDFAPPKVR